MNLVQIFLGKITTSLYIFLCSEVQLFLLNLYANSLPRLVPYLHLSLCLKPFSRSQLSIQNMMPRYRMTSTPRFVFKRSEPFSLTKVFRSILIEVLQVGPGGISILHTRARAADRSENPFPMRRLLNLQHGRQFDLPHASHALHVRVQMLSEGLRVVLQVNALQPLVQQLAVAA